MSARDLITAPVDFIVLAGQRSPGIATIENAEALRRLHERRAFGVAGATVIDQGGQLAHPVVRLEFTTPEQLDEWDTWKALLVRPASRSTQGMDIEHPILADLEIRSVLLEGRSQLTPDETGGISVVIKFCEYRAPVVALSVPDSTADVITDPAEILINAQSIAIAQLEADQGAP